MVIDSKNIGRINDFQHIYLIPLHKDVDTIRIPDPITFNG